ncbi:TPA: trp operon leader peptide [Salmonella enterica]|nr:trp operon leader peptide [Salmonella enterica]
MAATFGLHSWWRTS